MTTVTQDNPQCRRKDETNKLPNKLYTEEHAIPVYILLCHKHKSLVCEW